MKMKCFSKKCIFAFTICCFSLISCVNDVDLSNVSDEMQLDLTLVAPVGSAHVTLADILSRSETTDVDTTGGEIVILFKDTALFDRYENVTLKALSSSHGYDELEYGGTSYTFNSGETLNDFVFLDTISTGTDNVNQLVERIDSVLINTLNLTVSVQTTNLNITNIDNFSVTLSFPAGAAFDSDGNPLAPLTLTSADVTSGTSKSWNLSNVRLVNLDNEKGIPYEIKINGTVGSGGLTIDNTLQVDLSFSPVEFDYKAIYGKFKASVKGYSYDGYDFDFQESANSKLKFYNPTVALSVRSNIGAQFNFHIDSVMGFRKATPSNKIYADFGGGNKSATIEMTTRSYVPGEWSQFEYLKTLNRDFGGTHLLFLDSVPERIEYGFSSTVKDESGPMFLVPDAQIEVAIDGRLPLYLDAGSFYNYNDTITEVAKNVNNILNDSASNTEIDLKKVSLVLKLTNAMPIDAEFTLKFLDENGDEIVTDIVKTYRVEAPPVDNEGKVANPQGVEPQIIIIELTKDQIDNVLRKTENIAYTINSEGESDNAKIHVTTKDYLKVVIGVAAEGLVNLNSKK